MFTIRYTIKISHIADSALANKINWKCQNSQADKLFLLLRKKRYIMLGSILVHQKHC